MTPYIYALGFFDGVHVGHQALLTQCLGLAEAKGVQPGVVTFESHPDALVLGHTPALINTPGDRERLLMRFGMERIVTLPFDRKMLSTPWQDFLNMLITDYGAAGFVVGEDFRFGSHGAGTAQSLLAYCEARKIPAVVVPEQYLRGTRISSTYIRELFAQGDLEQAEEFLGHPHILSGKVVHGKQLGRTLGIPTANLRLPEGLVVPRFGVYACRVRIDGANYPAVTNIGTRPTVDGQGITVEPWILGFDGDLYGQELTLEFHRFLRPEQRFASLDAMQAEIRHNAQETLALFQK